MQAKDGVTLSTAWMQLEQQQQLCSKARYCPVDTPATSLCNRRRTAEGSWKRPPAERSLRLQGLESRLDAMAPLAGFQGTSAQHCRAL